MMKVAIKSLFLLAALALVGCSGKIYKTALGAERGAEVVFDDFSKVTKISLNGGKRGASHNFIYNYKDGVGEYYIAAYHRGGELIGQRCIDSNGIDLSCKRTHLEFDSYWVGRSLITQTVETFVFSVDENQLKTYAANGDLSFKVYGKNFNKIWVVPSTHLLGFLSRVDRYKREGK